MVLAIRYQTSISYWSNTVFAQYFVVCFYRNRSSASTSELSASSSSRWTVYHPHYKALGVLPQVRLAERDHLLLEQRNTRMLQDRLTVKVAPPDVIRQPDQL